MPAYLFVLLESLAFRGALRKSARVKLKLGSDVNILLGRTLHKWAHAPCRNHQLDTDSSTARKGRKEDGGVALKGSAAENGLVLGAPLVTVRLYGALKSF